jgi:hypothetical protein
MGSKDCTHTGENTADPAFEPRRLKSAAGWYVRVSWRYGQVEHVGGFTSEDEAESWITKKSKEWLLNRAAALRRA